MKLLKNIDKNYKKSIKNNEKIRKNSEKNEI